MASKGYSARRVTKVRKTLKQYREWLSYHCELALFFKARAKNKAEEQAWQARYVAFSNAAYQFDRMTL